MQTFSTNLAQRRRKQEASPLLFRRLKNIHMPHLPVQILSAAQHATLRSIRLHASVRQSMLQLWRSLLDSLRVDNNLEGAELLIFLFLL